MSGSEVAAAWFLAAFVVALARDLTRSDNE